MRTARTVARPSLSRLITSGAIGGAGASTYRLSSVPAGSTGATDSATFEGDWASAEVIEHKPTAVRSATGRYEIRPTCCVLRTGPLRCAHPTPVTRSVLSQRDQRLDAARSACG